MPTAKFKIDVDAKGAQAGMAAVQKHVKALGSTAGQLGSSLKGGIATVLGVATIGGLVHSMADFADEIQNASDRLGVASDRVQNFRIAAKRAGYDLGAFDKIFAQMEKSFSGALGGGSQMDILKKFGLSKDDVAHLNKADALQKILEGSQNMSDSLARGNLSKIFGSKGSNALMAMREDILSGNPDRIISADAISQMDEFMDAIADTRDAITQGLLPAFTELVKWISEKTTGFVEDTSNGNKMYAEASALYANKYGKEASSPFNPLTIAEGVAYQANIAGANAFHSGEDRKKAIAAAQKQYISNLFGEDIYNDLMKDFQATPNLLDNLKASQEKRRKERADRQAMLAGGVSRLASGGKEKDSEAIAPSANLGGSDLVRIGGILGVDARYRMEKLSIQANKFLERIANATEELRNNGISTNSDDDQEWSG